jgi:hypothetical protein
VTYDVTDEAPKNCATSRIARQLQKRWDTSGKEKEAEYPGLPLFRFRQFVLSPLTRRSHTLPTLAAALAQDHGYAAMKHYPTHGRKRSIRHKQTHIHFSLYICYGFTNEKGDFSHHSESVRLAANSGEAEAVFTIVLYIPVHVLETL